MGLHYKLGNDLSPFLLRWGGKLKIHVFYVFCKFSLNDNSVLHCSIVASIEIINFWTDIISENIAKVSFSSWLGR